MHFLRSWTRSAVGSRRLSDKTAVLPSGGLLCGGGREWKQERDSVNIQVGFPSRQVCVCGISRFLLELENSFIDLSGSKTKKIHFSTRASSKCFGARGTN